MERIMTQPNKTPSPDGSTGDIAQPAPPPPSDPAKEISADDASLVKGGVKKTMSTQ
jgi:hypothetical protein